MAPQNRAAWLKEKQAPVMVVDDAPYSKPEADELVIRTKAIAFNPVDAGIQKVGMLLEHYPAILGCDVTGVVEEVGSEVTAFKLGDHVLGAANPLLSSGGLYKRSGFQEYVVLKMPQIAKIPDDVAFTDAAVLPLSIDTASQCLFWKETLGLAMPPSDAGKGKTLLVWGASSSVGSCGVQLAVAAGYEVFGVASKRNHDFVKSIGAAQCFDHNDANLIDNAVAALQGKEIVGAYDAISKKETLGPICEILDKSGGRKVIAGVLPGAESLASHGVKIVTNFVEETSKAAVARHIWRVFLEPAVGSNAFQYKPTPEIVGHGLQDVQKGCDLIGQGVSAKKIVITM